jgi:hypothetical protein
MPQMANPKAAQALVAQEAQVQAARAQPQISDVQKEAAMKGALSQARPIPQQQFSQSAAQAAQMGAAPTGLAAMAKQQMGTGLGGMGGLGGAGGAGLAGMARPQQGMTQSQLQGGAKPMGGLGGAGGGGLGGMSGAGMPQVQQMAPQSKQPMGPPKTMKKGGSVKSSPAKTMASGGKVSSASKRADGCAIKGKTKGRII